MEKRRIIKSIIHEASHYYDLGINNQDVNNEFKKILLKKFNIDRKSYISIDEGFTELNASIFNTIFNFYYKYNPINPNLNLNSHNSNQLTKLFYNETIFSIKQSAKIFKLCNFKNTSDFLSKTQTKNKIKQHSDVVSYHIFKSIFLFNLDTIYELNSNNNTMKTSLQQLIHFNNNQKFKKSIIKII